MNSLESMVQRILAFDLSDARVYKITNGSRIYTENLCIWIYEYEGETLFVGHVPTGDSSLAWGFMP